MVKGVINESMNKQLTIQVAKLKGAKSYLETLEVERYTDGVSIDEEIELIKGEIRGLEDSIGYYIDRLTCMGYTVNPEYRGLISN